ncbi:hypothetical protein OS493_014017 [Desmophyllum pertusum]|uniref:Uncharacterized protein n=1 Tax=Desmophyllum pertusum TaxID=174260 RepID=A0A9W9ZDE8_9CNID|nr:hypothetical protein OS493_014017 [Desmophyllum pertusum]
MFLLVLDLDLLLSLFFLALCAATAAQMWPKPMSWIQFCPQWDYHIGQPIFVIYTCKDRCGVDERDASVAYLPRCFCDKLCDEFGDCCFDFDALCRTHVNPETSSLTSNETCLALKSIGFNSHPKYTGYAVWSTCPQNWTEGSVRQKCRDEDQNDFLRNLPVFDKDSHVTYKNIFCARCNGAVNTTYWKLQFDCAVWFNVTTFLTFNLTSDMGFLHDKCLVDKSPEGVQLNFLKLCIPRFQDCRNISQEKNEPYCQTECLSSTSKYSITCKVQDRQAHGPQCSLDEVYDPCAGSCKKIVPPGSYNKHHQHKHNDTQEWNPNCTFIAFNKTDYKQLSNGSIYLKLHNKIYSNTTYTIRDNRLLLCVNFTRNVTGTEKEHGIRKMKTTPASLQLLTSIGCIVSMVSLVLLLITYILFAELRNLPGKIIINLAFSLLLYQSVLFSAVKTDDQEACLAVAVLLHYFVISSFTWMNVMAYDVHRIFTATSVGVAGNRRGSYKKRLMKYCLYAWGAPAFIVLICVVVDHIKKGSIGYGFFIFLSISPV